MKAKQIKFLAALLTESTVTKAIETAGITRGTAYKYLNDPDFKKELEQRKSEFITDTVRYLQGKLSLCNETLVGIVTDKNSTDAAKIAAANAIYSNCKSMMETAEIISRLENIEKAVDDK